MDMHMTMEPGHHHDDRPSIWDSPRLPEWLLVIVAAQSLAIIWLIIWVNQIRHALGG
jgi:hypothetical protein